MISISIKIKKEDKHIMIYGISKIVDILEVQNRRIEDICTKEMLLAIKAKLTATSTDSCAIRMNIAQSIYFLKFLEMYAQYGLYEMSNAGLLKAQIEKKIKEKYINT